MVSRFALLTPLLFCGLATGAHEPMTRISVSVVNAAGNPIDHADVVVESVSAGKAGGKWRQRTQVARVVKAPEEMPQGAILVEATADEYEPFSQTFQVNE